MKTLRQICDEAIKSAHQDAMESHKQDFNSYGSGWDAGYLEALRERKEPYISALDLIEKLVDALHFYGGEADFIARKFKDISNIEAVEASLAVLSLDGGRRFNEALAAVKEFEDRQNG